MRKIPSILLLLLLTAIVSSAQKSINIPQRSSESDLEHTKWIDSVMRSILTIKPGATRKNLLTVFTEGGMSTRTHRKYVYKQCPYIKVDVEFAPVGKQDRPFIEMPEDRIIMISRPYLEYGIYD